MGETEMKVKLDLWFLWTTFCQPNSWLVFLFLEILRSPLTPLTSPVSCVLVWCLAEHYMPEGRWQITRVFHMNLINLHGCNHDQCTLNAVKFHLRPAMTVKVSQGDLCNLVIGNSIAKRLTETHLTDCSLRADGMMDVLLVLCWI